MGNSMTADSTGDVVQDFNLWWDEMGGREHIASRIPCDRQLVHKDVCAMAFGAGWGAGRSAEQQRKKEASMGGNR